MDDTARSGGPQGTITDILGELVSEASAELEAEATLGGIDENDTAIVRLANQIIADALAGKYDKPK